jgi:hypothetical protein
VALAQAGLCRARARSQQLRLCARGRPPGRGEREADGALYVRERRQAAPHAAGPQAGAGPGEAAFRYQLEDGIGVFYWIDERCGYALSGQMDRGQLLAISRLVYGQLAAAESAPR